MKNWNAKFTLFLVVWLSIAGCASSRYVRTAGVNEWSVAQVLHRALDRWVAWESMTAEFRVKITSGDSSAVARGHLIYLMGERLEFGFRKPWNRFIGTFYIIPEQSVYWGSSPIPQVYGLGKEIDLASLMVYPFPDWDPRDILPLPISGRTSGLQPDSVWSVGAFSFVRAKSDQVTYLLTLSMNSGTVNSERVERTGRAAAFKSYRRTKTIQGWSIPTEVVCADSAGDFRIEWKLSRIYMKAQDYMLDDSISTFTTPTSNSE